MLYILKGQCASSNRFVGDISIFDMNTNDEFWGKIYGLIMDKKYAKGGRNFSQNIYGAPFTEGIAPIYLIPRERGGPSYLSVNLDGVDKNNVQYCPISKGFSMQNVSSFTLGPIVGEGLCLVNAAFSKCICIAHIEGNGKVNYKRKNFWARSKNPQHIIQYINDKYMLVDNIKVNIVDWLTSNKDLWFPEWEIWRRSIALCSMGDFHWCDNLGNVLKYKKGDKYMDFVEWKKECYIKPSYELLPHTDVYKFLHYVWKENNIPLGLVHPKAVLGEAEKPITVEYIRQLYDSPDDMCCQPYVVAGCLLNVPI